MDYIMIDLRRVGGVTKWMKVAGMAEAFNLPATPRPDASASGCRCRRADGGHAVDVEAVPGDAGDREGPVGAADQAGPRVEVRREGGCGVPGLSASRERYRRGRRRAGEGS